MSELAEKTRRLLSTLGSIHALEVLLLLARSPDRSWSAGQVASALHTVARVESTLERLAQLNLVDVRLGNDVLYRCAPASPALADAVRQLAADYEERRLLVLEALVVDTLDPGSPIKEFAEAFRLRRRKRNG